MQQSVFGRRRSSPVVTVIALTLALAAASVRGETLNISSSSYGYTEVRGESQYRQPANPTAATDTVSFNSQTSATTYALNDASFGIGIRHSRDGGLYQLAKSYGQIYFSIAPDVAVGSLNYTATGNYAVTDGQSNSSGEVYINSYFLDTTTSTFLYHSRQYSSSTPGETFTLGGTDGDGSSVFGGSLTGSLIAGHSYAWYYEAYTHAYPDEDSGATAVGNFSLAFDHTSAAAVPLPAAAWGGMALFGGIGAARAVRRRR